jgi:hypothetical protein
MSSEQVIKFKNFINKKILGKSKNDISSHNHYIKNNVYVYSDSDFSDNGTPTYLVKIAYVVDKKEIYSITTEDYKDAHFFLNAFLRINKNKLGNFIWT